MSQNDTGQRRSTAADNFRTFLTVLVVFHHSCLAYDRNLQLYTPDENVRSVSPIIDSDNSVWVSYLVEMNDVFMMPLMFYISGLFLLPSIGRGSRSTFLKKRLLRLGVPFIFMVGVLVPIAFHAGSLAQRNQVSLWSDWWDGFVQLSWPLGPAWFLSTLLVFDVLGSNHRILGVLRNATFYTRFARLMRNPAVAFPAIVGVSFLCYLVPFVMAGPSFWVGLGPIAIQASRIGLYAFYFLLGVAVGALPGSGFDKDILGLRNRRSVLGWGCVFLLSAMFAWLIATDHSRSPNDVLAIAGVVAASAMLCGAAFGLLQAIFLRTEGSFEWFFKELRPTAYGIYCLHYPIVTWLQFAVLNVEAPAFAKLLFVFATALLSSCAITWLLRQSATVRKIL
jgi:hypothetical protein